MNRLLLVLCGLFLASSAFPQSPRVRSDQACTDIGGTCLDWKTNTCTAGWESGLCDGDVNRKCCKNCDSTCQSQEDGYNDSACETTSTNTCMDNSNFCHGAYESGVCGGPSSRQCCKALDSGCPVWITRAEWGARSASSKSYISENRPYLFVHHSAGNMCSTQSECESIVRGIQNYHMDSNGWSDIGYSFLVGGDGNIYEGRGLLVQGAHTSGYNTQGYGTCFLGNFMTDAVDSTMNDVYLNFQACLGNSVFVSSSFNMYGHRQAGTTECPGDNLYDEIQSWPHWTSGSPP